MKVRALSEETLQQNEELALWRLASQPAQTFDQFHSEIQDHIPAVKQSQSDQQTDEKSQNQVQPPYLGVQESPGNVTVIREDELYLSCSSNKLQGRMLFSR